MNKIIIIAVVAVVASARPQHGHSEGHGHASSSHSIVLHQSEGTEHAQPGVVLAHQEDHQYYAHPKYQFEYKVEDPHTGDNKYHHETRDGDVVRGVYGLLDADGTHRIVEYTADKHTGFNAVVRREGHAKHIVPEKHEYHH